MIKANIRHFLIMFFIVAGTIVLAFSDQPQKPSYAEPIKKNEIGPEPFDKMMAVLTHKRCVNCHPAGNRPLQGEDSHIHNFNVQRGIANNGEEGLACNTCHHEENNDYAGIPGAPEWALAPLKMKWEGLTRVEIAQSILDPERNGGRTLQETVKHLTEHKLVLWAWEPGVDAEGHPREKPPVPKDEYIAAVKAWAANGAIIPEE